MPAGQKTTLLMAILLVIAGTVPARAQQQNGRQLPVLPADSNGLQLRPLPGSSLMGDVRSSQIRASGFHVSTHQDPELKQPELSRDDADASVARSQEPGGPDMDRPEDEKPGSGDKPAGSATAKPQASTLRPITDVNINILMAGSARLPEDRSEELFAGRIGMASGYQRPVAVCQWEAPCIAYRRLYFEDPILERYGKCSSPPRDVLRSAGQFSTALILWPLRGLADAPGACESPLGYCRPGNPSCCWQDLQIGR